MKAIPILPALLLLAGCGGGGSSAPPAQPPPSVPFSISISPSAPWSVTYSKGAVWSGDGFDFPVCVDATTCSVNYVEYPMQANIGASAGISMSWIITGVDPVFDYRTNPNNTCGTGTPGELSIMFRRLGADVNNDRWFTKRRAPLAMGASSFSVTLHDIAEWTGVFGSNAALFSSALANIWAVGFVFGGGCFSGHGVAVTSGNARFTLVDYIIR